MSDFDLELNNKNKLIFKLLSHGVIIYSKKLDEDTNKWKEDRIHYIYIGFDNLLKVSDFLKKINKVLCLK